MDSLDQA
jgi:hypothetical protein